MKRILFALTILLVGFNPLLLQAQQVWSLEKCINYALENNIKIKQGAISTEYQKNQLQQTKFSRLPSLNGQTSQNMNFGRSLTYENTYKDSMKLAMIRSRIEAKYYNDPKILEKIALAVFSII